MIKIIFKNLDKSELAKEAVYERVSPLLEKFPQLKKDTIIFTLSMDNSPVQAGPDLFRVKLQLNNGQYKGVLLERSAKSLYLALAEVIEKIHERLKRHDEKMRNTQRAIQRKKKSKILNHIEAIETHNIYSF
jgi:ribosome-associated translation inhibitor RaiA